MKKLILLFLFIAQLFSFEEDDFMNKFDIYHFKTVSNSILLKSPEELIEKIVPSIKYKYWQCIYCRPSYNGRSIVVLLKGDTSYKKIADKTISSKLSMLPINLSILSLS